jgi:YVTN family beta-propeller protein
VAVTPDGAHVYVTNMADGTVSVFDTATNAQVALVTVGAVGTAPFGIAATPDSAHVYVGFASASPVSVIATATNTVVATVAVGTAPVSFGQFIALPPARTLAQQIADLLELVSRVNPSLATRIATGLATFATRNPPLACFLTLGLLQDVNAAQRAHRIPADKAAQIIADINGIRATLHCAP